MANYVFQPYPAWLTAPDGKRVLVDNAAAEAALRDEWDAHKPAPMKEASGDTSASEGASDIAELRQAYKEKFGKRAFPGWDADELRKRMAAA